MAPRKKRWDEEDEGIMGGHPAEDPDYDPDADLQEEEPDEDDPPPEKKPKNDEVKILQAQMLEMERRHAEQMDALRRQIPPATPKPQPQPQSDAVNYSELIFKDPNRAVALIKAEAKREIQQEMTQQYNQDQGQKQFWAEFYDEYPDLKGDRDLVTATLNGNLADLANIPVSKAKEKLAELTRERILRYRNRPSQRAVAEGASPPKAKPPERDEKVPSLGDVIRARKKARQRASAA